jgi:hypothetical protein
MKDFELLLKGLLTMDYQKRWGEGEVRRWLDGERDIPVYYLQTQQTEKLTPYPSGERVYYEIRELLASFTENEKAWKRGCEALYRGELEIWLAGNRQEEDKKKIGEVKNRYIDQKDRQDAGLFELIYAYNAQLPFCFCGIKINVANLRIFCGKQVKKESLTQAEAGVAKAVSDGTLLRLYQWYLNVAQMRDDELEAVLDLLKNAEIPERQWICLLAVFIAPREYYWPPFAGNLIKSQQRDRLDFVRQRRIPWICPLAELQNRVITHELAIKMQNPVSYDEFLTEMERLLSQPNTDQADDTRPMTFSNCDGSQFTVRIAQNRQTEPPRPQSQPRPAENTRGHSPSLSELVKGAVTRVTCLISGHAWSGCKCTRCAKKRDVEHTFILIAGKCEQKFSNCGKIEKLDHQWVGNNCGRCGAYKSVADKFWGFIGEHLPFSRLGKKRKQKNIIAEDTSGDTGAYSRSQEPSSYVYKETAPPYKESFGRERGRQGNFGSAIKRVLIDIAVFSAIMVLLVITTKNLSAAARERVLMTFLLILLGAGIGSIISFIRRIKGRPGFILNVMGSLGAWFVAEVIMASFGAPSGIGSIVILMLAGIDGIISAIRRILVRQRE